MPKNSVTPLYEPAINHAAYSRGAHARHYFEYRAGRENGARPNCDCLHTLLPQRRCQRIRQNYTYVNAFTGSMMRIVDVPDAQRVDCSPDDVEVMLSSGGFVQDGFEVRRVELRLYQTDQTHGTYSIITSFVDTDRGSIEMVYDEGYRGEEPLAGAVKFLTSQMGLSALILRSIIAIGSKL